jgi:hypothetical protein
MGAPRSLDIDLLRSFLLIAGGVSFTHTAERVGRTQAAVTLQIKRLEAMVGHSTTIFLARWKANIRLSPFPSKRRRPASRQSPFFPSRT